MQQLLPDDMFPVAGESPGHATIPDLRPPSGVDLVAAGAVLDAETGRGRDSLAAEALHQPPAQVMLACDWPTRL